MKNVRFMGSLLVGLGAIYIAIMVFMFFFQKHLVFHPSGNIHSTPGDLGQPFEDVEMVTDDGITLHGWFLPGADDGRTLILFHGNAGNISDRVSFISDLRKLGINVFIFDYRGYGKSGGTPDEEGLYTDARAAWRYITEKRENEADRIILFGRSLGSAVAVKLASEQPAGALILEAPFTSGVDLGAEIYPWLPVRWLMKYKFGNEELIRNITLPVLIAHSRTDRVVPYHHGEQLYEAANEPKEFVELSGHHGAGFDNRRHFFERIQQFINRHVP